MKVFAATFGTETNTFSPMVTSWSGFKDTMYWAPGTHPDFATEATAPLWLGRELAQKRGWQLVEGTCAFAMPAGPVVQEVYEAIRDEILGQIAAAMPLDMIALGLHGAMCAFNYPDCEGDFLTRIRALVGNDTVIGIEIDPHAHLSALMVQTTDMIVAFKEYPHTDFVDRAHDLYGLLEAIAQKKIRPVPFVFDCRLIGGLRTTAEPMKSFVAEMKAYEADGTVLSVSAIHGFPLGDNADMGSKIIVYTNDDPIKAKKIATALGERFRAIVMDAHRGHPQSPDQDLDRALQSTAYPVIIADASDNPGGGNAGDNMELARALIDQGVEASCVGIIWDPQAVGFCHEAGLGARMSLRIGGKVGPESGMPLDLLVEVTGLARDVAQVIDGGRIPLGDVAAVRAGDTQIVMSTLRDQVYDRSAFEAVGIDVRNLRYLVVKSSQQFRIGLEALAGEIFVIRRGPNLTDRHFNHRPRPLWPFELNGSTDGK